MESAVALPRGYTLNEYRIEATLGVGGFGLTYLATDANLDRRVAIKEYLPNDLALRDADQSVSLRSDGARQTFDWGRARFLDESRTLASFHHPNIVRVMRFFEANRTAYMVMEFVAGDPLNEWMGTRRPLPQARAVALVQALLDGLDVVHRAGYLHRDIKPANIFVREDGSPVLLDFGSARAARGGEMTAIVTPGYAPLEQYHATGNQGPWSDIYSLGAVLYWMVIGAKPLESVARARTDAMPAAARVGDRTRYSPEFLQAIDWALAPGEEARPQTVADWRAALAAAPPVAGSDAPTMLPVFTPESAPAPSMTLSAPVTLVDAATRTRIEALLAAHIGPIAPLAFKRAARRASAAAELFEMLADEIEADDARAAFVKACEAALRAAARDPASRPASRPLAPDPASRPASQPLSAPATTRPPGAAPGQAASRVVASSLVEPVSQVPSQPASRPASQPLSQPLSRPLTQAPGGAVARPERPLDLTLETMAAAEAAIVKYNGAISKAIVKRAAARARDETEFHLLVSDAIEEPAARRAYLRRFMPTSRH